MDKLNKMAKEVTKEQMEKVTGGGMPTTPSNPTLPRPRGKDCFLCKGLIKNSPTNEVCKKALEQVDGKLYRCTNPLCTLFFQDQYPNGK